MGKEDFTTTQTGINSGLYHNTNTLHTAEPLKTRVEANHAADKTQLKAEHGKEMAQLKADEVQARADLKAQHAQTKGGTGLIAKITGREDPVKKAEKEQLKAEIDRAEEATKAQQKMEKADLDARTTNEKASVDAASKLRADTHHSAGSGLHHTNNNVAYVQQPLNTTGNNVAYVQQPLNTGNNVAYVQQPLNTTGVNSNNLHHTNNVAYVQQPLDSGLHHHTNVGHQQPLDSGLHHHTNAVHHQQPLNSGLHHQQPLNSTNLHNNTNATGLHHTKVQEPLKTRVEADHAADKVQLKAEHGKEMAELKAEEVERRAELKAEHAKTKGGTGLIAKITGKEDPVKKAEKAVLKAEINRAEEVTKAQHAIEKAELDAKIAKDKAMVGTVGSKLPADSHRTTTY